MLYLFCFSILLFHTSTFSSPRLFLIPTLPKLASLLNKPRPGRVPRQIAILYGSHAFRMDPNSFGAVSIDLAIADDGIAAGIDRHSCLGVSGNEAVQQLSLT